MREAIGTICLVVIGLGVYDVLMIAAHALLRRLEMRLLPRPAPPRDRF